MHIMPNGLSDFSVKKISIHYCHCLHVNLIDSHRKKYILPIKIDFWLWCSMCVCPSVCLFVRQRVANAKSNSGQGRKNKTKGMLGVVHYVNSLSVLDMSNKPWKRTQNKSITLIDIKLKVQINIIIQPEHTQAKTDTHTNTLCVCVCVLCCYCE